MIAARAALHGGAVARVAALLTGLGTLAAAVLAGTGIELALGLVLLALLSVTWRTALSWRTLLVALLVVILFVPMRRYALPGALPFQLEAYRVLIGFVAVLWLMSLLVDPRVRIVRTAIDRPLLLVLGVSAASVVVNLPRLESELTTSDAVKQLTFLVSFVVLAFMVVSLVTRADEVDLFLRVLVGSAGVVALFGLVELRTGFNIFDQLDQVVPFLNDTGDTAQLTRGGYRRVVGSSQHPIALGAMFVLLIPISLYLGRRAGRRHWFGVAALLALGTLATGSRTGIVMLLAAGIVSLVLRPRETARFWPALLPLLVVVHFAMPGALGGFYKSFFPAGGLIAEQADAQVGSSRVASLGPGLHEVALNPLLGSGFGARIFHGPNANSFIVDDQWLSTAMETGLLGLCAWLWLFVAFLRRMFRAAREDDGEPGWLFTALAASGTAFAVGMLTYDAFSFIQTTLVLFLLLALGCAALGVRAREATG